MEPMKVEIWSDIVCPWCYIGKRRFETALARFDHRDQVEVVWRSFELDPAAPSRADGTLEAMLAQKYGVSTAQAADMNARVTALAAAEEAVSGIQGALVLSRALEDRDIFARTISRLAGRLAAMKRGDRQWPLARQKRRYGRSDYG